MADLDTALHNLYLSFSSVPDVSGARFCRAIHQKEQPFTGIELKTSQRDFYRKTKRRFSSFISLSPQSYGEVDAPIQLNPVDDSSSVGSITSPSEDFKIILRNILNDPNNQGKKGLYIEIYQYGTLVHNVNVTSIHGDFYGDGTFGCLRFNKSEDKLVYVAEKNIDSEEPKKENMKDKPWLLINDESEAYEENQDWGETFVNKRRPSLFVLNLSPLFDNKSPIYAFKVEDVAKLVPLNIPEGGELFDPGQACFSPNEDDVLYFTGYKKTPRKHGIIYCQNRPSRIYKIKIDGSSLCAISSENISSRNPQFYNDCAEYLYYLQSETGGAHASCSRIAKLDLNTKIESILVDFVSEHPSSDAFPGLYVDGLSHKLLTADKQQFIVLGSLWRSHKVLLAVNIESISSNPIFHVISEAQQCGDSVWSFLDVSQDYILASRSQPNLPSELLIGKASPSGEGQELVVAWKSLYKFQPHHAIDGHNLSELKWEVYNHPERDQRLECILIKAIRPHASLKGKSLVINMHGGPHSASNVGWNWLNACLSWLGFDVLHVNYSGSTGYGSDFVNKLVGQVGDLDVKDCQYAMEKAWSNGSYHKRFVMGGSHGGFLTAHLIGQYPDYYAACMLRNPVINMGSMSFTTDIPDWCFAEAGLSYDFGALRLTSPEEYSILYRASPLQYVDSLKTPILLLLGLEDRRVPPTQGLQWYNQVSARHPGLMKMKLISNTGHPLDSAEGEYLTLLQTAKLFISSL
ncbi:hypothetical protein DSO57_1027727 [Entomophthora muscae]|uniref:Uncharacterized protein n=1 Tax=Entomophthora muscae TaxID=34485 RepID=A0ACC2SQY4_9FUNG|nr:hypothetical protein DSO57_1027727 [Entomophthora muscae]